MTPIRPRVLAALTAALAIMAGTYGALALTGTTSYAQESSEQSVAAADRAQAERRPPGARTLRVDIAENGTRFVFDEAPVFDDGFPAYGNPFVTEGYIYPAGTLDGTNGVNPDGSPEFPDKVIGKWLCRGYLIGDGAHTSEGALVFTTQLFSFGDDPDLGNRSLVVTGLEGAEDGVPVDGAVTGGTGRYATARGEVSQTLLGFNNPDNPAAHGINKRVRFELARP